MCARILPFPTLDADGIDRLVDRARLSRENKIIAREYLRGEKIVDIAVLRASADDLRAHQRRSRYD